MQRFISQENKHNFPDGWAVNQAEELTRDEFLMELSDAIELRLMKHERKASEKCNHSNFVKTEHLTGEGAMEYVEWFDNTCSDCGKHWTTNN